MAQKGFNGISEDLKAKLNELIEQSGLTDREWLEQATNLYILNEMKNIAPEFKPDITEIEIHINRIAEVVTNMAQRSMFLREEAVRKLSEELEAARLVFEQTNGELMERQKDLRESNEENGRLKESLETTKAYASQMERSLEKNDHLIREIQEKNQKLGEMLVEYREGHDAAADLKRRLEEEERKTAALQATVAQQNEAHEQSIQQLQDRHKDEMERQAERLELKRDREILQVRAELQEQARKEAENTTEAIRSLYERIEQQRQEYEKRIVTLQQPQNNNRKPKNNEGDPS